MALSDYIVCCKCGVKLIYDGNREQRDWWEQRWNKEPEIECPDCKTEQRKPLKDEQCVWDRPDPDWQPDTWEAKCGAMWTFTEGGPKDNDMRYCPQCGKPTIEAAHGIKE